MNLVFLVGNLGSNPYKIDVPDGKHLGASFNLATNEKFNLKGEFIQKTEWHKVTAWGKSAEYCLNNFTKGARVLVKGKIRNTEYTAKDGAKHHNYEIYAEELRMISPAKSKEVDLAVE